MGNSIGKAMDENLKKNQEFMKEMNRITVERQIQMQNQMREKMAATQIAMARERMTWLGSFYVLACVAMIKGYRSGSRAAAAPFLPLTFLVAYQADLAYGTKLNRVKSEAESILMYERDIIEIPSGLPTLSSLDAGRQKPAETAKSSEK